MSWFGEDTNALKQKARKEYEKACELLDSSKQTRAYRMHAYLRARAHVDKLFVEATRQAEAYNDLLTLSVIEGTAAPEKNAGDAFIKLKTTDGEIWSFLPQEYVCKGFDLGWLYQGMVISGPKALFEIQKIVNLIGDQMHADTHLHALSFLKDQLEEEGVNVDAELAELEESEL